MIKKTYNYLKEKAIKFKKWLVILIFGAAVLAAPLAFPVPDVALEKIQADYNVSQIKDKYRLEKTAFILDAVDENAIQTEVGNKNSDEFLPELTLRKWSDEVNLKVKHRHNEKKKDLKFELDGKKIKLKGKKIETHFYEMENAYEFEIILLEKPDVNVVEFDIESKGLKFYYQPELTQKEKDDGAFRPENVVGSYAVYHESKAGDYSKMGKKNYRAGKAFHIYRPKIIDNAGTEVWGELNITDNLLTVEIPQEFLDNAVYPIRVDPTFGYTSIAASHADHTYDRMYACKFPLGETGDVSSLHFYGKKAQSGTGHWSMAIYDDDGASAKPGTLKDETPDATYTTTTAWRSENVSGGVELSAGDWYITFWSYDTSHLYYDSGDTGQTQYKSQAYTSGNPSWPSSFGTPTGNYNDYYSFYCTYTAGGAERRMFLIE